VVVFKLDCGEAGACGYQPEPAYGSVEVTVVHWL
jgi:hypothetical protein